MLELCDAGIGRHQFSLPCALTPPTYQDTEPLSGCRNKQEMLPWALAHSQALLKPSRLMASSSWYPGCLVRSSMTWWWVTVPIPIQITRTLRALRVWGAVGSIAQQLTPRVLKTFNSRFNSCFLHSEERLLLVPVFLWFLLSWPVKSVKLSVLRCCVHLTSSTTRRHVYSPQHGAWQSQTLGTR